MARTKEVITRAINVSYVVATTIFLVLVIVVLVMKVWPYQILEFPEAKNENGAYVVSATKETFTPGERLSYVIKFKKHYDLPASILVEYITTSGRLAASNTPPDRRASIGDYQGVKGSAGVVVDIDTIPLFLVPDYYYSYIYVTYRPNPFRTVTYKLKVEPYEIGPGHIIYLP